MWLGLLGTAFAQDEVTVPEIDAQNYRHPVDAESTLWADDSGAAPDGYIAAKLVTGYVHAPFVFFYDNGDRVALVKDALSFDAIGSASFKRIRLGVDVPVYALATGDQASGGGLGDIALDLKGTILPRADYPIGLALAGRLKLPTGTVAVPLSNPSGSVGWELEAIVDQRIGNVLLAFNLGERGGPKTRLVNVDLNDSMFARIGVGYALNERVGFSADLASGFDWASFGQGASTPLEAMLGANGRIGDSPLVLRGGVGTGLSRGIGSPTFRGVLSVGYEPEKDKDSDHDGLVDRKDQCPADPEDIDQFEDSNGCPDTDNDKDGVLDLADSCRDIAEDKDGYKDTDGCPDPNTEVHIRFLDPDKKLAPGVQAVIAGYSSGKEVRETGDEDFVVEMPPGSYTWTAQAPKFLPAKGTLSVMAGAPQNIDLRIDPDIPPGEVRVHVVAPGNKPIATATVSFDDGTPEATDRGEMSAVLPAKSFRITARAEGYAPQTLTTTVKGGGVTDVIIELKPSKVKVTKEKLDIKDKVFFEVNKATIKPESFPLLDEIARILLDRPDILKLRIEGHTDSQGNDDFNLKLSQDRAASVRQYFIDKGVAADRLESFGFGETKPIDFGKTQKAYEKNRRVEFFIAQWADQ